MGKKAAEERAAAEKAAAEKKAAEERAAAEKAAAEKRDAEEKASKTALESPGAQVELRWMFADARGIVGGTDMAEKDPLGRFWSKLLLPDKLAEDIDNHCQKNPKDKGRPIRINTASRDVESKNEFTSPEVAIDWLRSATPLE